MVGLLLLAFYLGWLPLEASYEPLMIAVAITVAALGIGSVPHAGLQGLFRFGHVSSVRVIEAAANIVISVTLVVLGLGALGALSGFAAAAVLACLLYVLFILDKPFWRVRGWDNLSAVRQAVPMTLAVFGGVLLTNIDLLAVKFLTGQGLSDELAGAYQVAAVLARAPYFVGTALVAAFYPRIAQEWSERAAENRIQKTEYRTHSEQVLLRWLALGILPMNVILAAAAPAVVLFFFPERYASVGPVLAVLAIGGLSWCRPARWLRSSRPTTAPACPRSS